MENYNELKSLLEIMENNLERYIDKNHPRFRQEETDRIYKNMSRLKREAYIVINRPNQSESMIKDYTTLLSELDKHTALLEPVVSNELLGIGGKRKKRNTRRKKTKRRKNNRRRTRRH